MFKALPAAVVVLIVLFCCFERVALMSGWLEEVLKVVEVAAEK